MSLLLAVDIYCAHKQMQDTRFKNITHNTLLALMSPDCKFTILSESPLFYRLPFGAISLWFCLCTNMMVIKVIKRHSIMADVHSQLVDIVRVDDCHFSFWLVSTSVRTMVNI